MDLALTLPTPRPPSPAPPTPPLSTPAAASPTRRCSEALHLSAAEAYLRIAAARASREHPVLLDLLRDGRLHLTAISLLAPHLTPESRDAVLARAAHKSRRQAEPSGPRGPSRRRPAP
jgi:hypothetical protein